MAKDKRLPDDMDDSVAKEMEGGMSKVSKAEKADNDPVIDFTRKPSKGKGLIDSVTDDDDGSPAERDDGFKRISKYIRVRVRKK